MNIRILKIFLRKESTHFGYKEVNLSEKQGQVNKVFTNVAKNYDKMNDAMSFFQHRCWKNHFVNCVNPRSNQKILDLAGGTGDISFRIADKMALDWKRCKYEGQFDVSKKGRLVISDINQKMLKYGQNRANSLGIKGLEYLVADAGKLPLDSNSFDIITISFGLRNCPEPPKVISEAYRVLKPGGKFMCLEFSQMDNIYLSLMYDSYSFNVIPVLGAVIAGDWNSYQYLVESIRMFYSKEELKKLFISSGFEHVSVEELFFGGVCIHQGFKPEVEEIVAE